MKKEALGVLYKMSLREEISGYMKELLDDPSGTFTYDVPLITDDIISKFEKRIDELETPNLGEGIPAWEMAIYTIKEMLK